MITPCPPCLEGRPLDVGEGIMFMSWHAKREQVRAPSFLCGRTYHKGGDIKVDCGGKGSGHGAVSVGLAGAVHKSSQKVEVFACIKKS